MEILTTASPTTLTTMLLGTFYALPQSTWEQLRIASEGRRLATVLAEQSYAAVTRTDQRHRGSLQAPTPRQAPSAAEDGEDGEALLVCQAKAEASSRTRPGGC